MNKMIVALSFVALAAMAFTPQGGNDSDKITAAVKLFVKSADKQDASSLESILHTEYRTVANRLFGSEEVSIMDKSTYIALLKQGKLGGDTRKVNISNISIQGNNAVVQARFEGKKTHL